jgi:hypothetical protein
VAESNRAGSQTTSDLDIDLSGQSRPVRQKDDNASQEIVRGHLNKSRRRYLSLDELQVECLVRLNLQRRTETVV